MGFGTEKFEELVNRRYGSPYGYLDRAVKNKRLEKVTDTILSQSEEDRCWSLYLAIVSNPFAEAGSFDDFMKKNKPKKAKPQIKKFDSKMQVMKAQKILSGFKPP